MRDFKKLKVWEKSHALTIEVYKVSATFPSEERYGLTSQIRRAAASIAANIAEGCGRNGDAELARFLHISMGSASETEYHALLARDLDLLSASEHEKLASAIEEIKKMLTGLIQTLRTPSTARTN